MTGPEQDDRTIDLGAAGPPTALRREFETAWQDALAGGPRPQLEDYLSRALEPDRPAVGLQLQQIDKAYEARLAGLVTVITPVASGSDGLAFAPTLPEATLDPGVVPAADRDPTCQLDGDPSGATMEHVSAVGQAPGAMCDGGTPDFSVAEALEESASHGPKVAGYEILGELGRGGMGVVYKARQKKLNRVVALKMVLAGAQAGERQLARFQTEAEAVAQLQHPNIVQIFEVGDHDGLPFFSLEFIDGDSLAHKISGKPRPPLEAAATVELLARGMAVAHDRGIIHRDLKPANILLTAAGVPKISDFGLAKRLEDDSSQTKHGTLLGTPSYMAPEQARGDTADVGPLSDLYALGAILYELLTGRPPFVGATMMETVLQVRSQDPVPPTRLQPKCPRDLETICLKCLQKEPNKRYAHCQALVDDLRHFLDGEPIKARPVGRIERAWRWCRRNPRIAALSAVVGGLLLALTAALVVVGVRFGMEREAVADTRKVAGERLERATEAIAAGNFQRARDLLYWSDPLLVSHPDLAEMRSGLDTLKAQVDTYAEFRQLLDNARFASWFGSLQQRKEGEKYGRQLLALYDDVEGRTGKGAAGLPPLNAEQEQLFKEDVFEAFLTAALVAQQLAKGGGEAAERQAAQQGIDWLNRAEQILPGTRALYVNRAQFYGTLGNREADKADLERAKAILPASAVDHFWHGFANHLRGEEARRKNDAKAAQECYRLEIAEYAAFLQLRPDHFWGYFNWAVCHAQLVEAHDLHDDLVRFTVCIRLRPDLPWPYNNRGTIHLNLKEYDLAVADFTAALERNDQYAEAYANRGLAYAAQFKDDAALEDFHKAVTLEPDYAPAYTARAEIFRKRKQFVEEVRDYTRLLPLTADKAALYEKRAAAYRALNQPDEAIQDYSRLIELNPKDLQVRASRSELLLGRKRYAEAREDFTRILDAAPKATVIWRARAILNWQNLKDFDAALEDFAEFAKLAPKDPEPHRCIGVILLGRRQYGPALEALQKALDLRPGYPEAIWAKAEIDLWQCRPEQALKELDALVAKLPEGPPETLNVRGGVYQAMGRLKEAADDYQRMTELKPKEPQAYVCLARLLEKQDEAGKAAACFDRLVAAAPESKWAYLRRAEYRRDRGEYDAALADCNQADRLEPGWALSALVRASVEAARGRPGPAVTDAERILTRAPKQDGRVLYTAACTWSLASRASTDQAEARSFADRAAGFLGEALDKGFHDLLYPEHNRMADDPALAPIRQLPQVRDLLDRCR
jgi:tetratricopeptide (TPR) repeat protein/tRNA A-37 threonylcarbamoyl transferase component Bud32